MGKNNKRKGAVPFNANKPSFLKSQKTGGNQSSDKASPEKPKYVAEDPGDSSSSGE